MTSLTPVDVLIGSPSWKQRIWYRVPRRVHVAINALQGRPVVYRCSFVESNAVVTFHGRHDHLLISECTIQSRLAAAGIVVRNNRIASHG